MTSRKSDADVCRDNGWGVGTDLVGDEGHGPDTIRITAIGDDKLLARQISHRGKPVYEAETLWTLRYRDWKPRPTEGDD